MELLRRHGLVRLTAAGWRQAIEQHDDDLVRQSLAHWSKQDLPAVVTTQGRGGVDGAAVALGVATPPAWGLRRIPLRVARTELRRDIGDFPAWDACADALPLPDQARAALESALAMLGGAARVYGSFGWQQLTGLAYVRPGSDLDLLLEPVDALHADRLCAALSAADIAGPRLDGELCFNDGSAVAWREWGAWRAGRAASIVVKRLDGPLLVSETASFGTAPASLATA
jgi:phosphoribosyl-dephospho-CoA transferase